MWELVSEGSYVILDSYYASAKVLQPFREHGLALISRVKLSTVARADFSSLKSPAGPGRPRKWGSKIKLRQLFAPLEQCSQASIELYGKRMTVHYQCFQFYWDSPEQKVLFCLDSVSHRQRVILLSSDLELAGPEVIEAYAWRFKIEVSFRTLVHLLGGFCYRFWLKGMTRACQWPRNLSLADYDQKAQRQIAQKVEAFERFVNLHAIALGILQLLALEMPNQVWTHLPRWFRSLPNHGYPSEQMVRLSLQSQLQTNLSKSKPALVLHKFLDGKIDLPKDPDTPALAA